LIFNFIRVVVVVGDGGPFPSVPGSPAAPTSSIYRALKKTSKMLGRFPQGHVLFGQQRLVVLKVNENYSSQIPSCWSTIQDENLPSKFIHRPHPHPLIPDAVPPEAQRLQQLNDIWSVKQCPHCRTIWNRDVLKCLQVLVIEMISVLITLFILEILVSFMKVFEIITKDLPCSGRNLSNGRLKPRPIYKDFFRKKVLKLRMHETYFLKCKISSNFNENVIDELELMNW
jgi:hypothetical protein